MNNSLEFLAAVGDKVAKLPEVGVAIEREARHISRVAQYLSEREVELERTYETFLYVLNEEWDAAELEEVGL